ncbi:DNA methylase [Meridianimarinicoccus roseus]|uniref:DNA methylase n=1 Tax=Meridianimarinicoccus roseus TaxID=2072018 RepID=A0A2V2LGA3_9RHOB|nr:DNA polymerase Y family protein [Meridianimarinicoccus roseus]PWR01439.1 DNA methylase [Meridianimarinicoccus roseus]
MPNRRILSLWFPRLGADRLLRRGRVPPDTPVVVIGGQRGAQVVTSLCPLAEAAGLRPGQGLRDAMAICPGLASYPADPRAESALLSALRRWAGQFTPWVAEEAPDALMLDITGCSHLFGGEAELAARLAEGCTDLGLNVRIGLADTPGAAWALARHGGTAAADPGGQGDAIDQEARATRSRAARRRGPLAPRTAPAATALRVGGPAGAGPDPAAPRSLCLVSPPGQVRATLAPLPVAGLRLPPGDVAALGRLGLRLIGDLAGQPRAALSRRFGAGLVRRLDQALGLEPEPLSPHRPGPRFVLRMALPDPIGLEADLLAGIDRLLPALCARLAGAGQGARSIRLEAMRCDHVTEEIEIGLAAATADVARIRPLLALKLGGIDAGPGIDALRLGAPRTERLQQRQHRGHLDAAEQARRTGPLAAQEDLVGRLGARLGSTAVTRLHPADSHIPEKTATTLTAGWSQAAAAWPPAPTPRPVLVWRSEPVTPVTPEDPSRVGTGEAAGQRPPHPDYRPPDVRLPPPAWFRWRRQDHACLEAIGPERIAPEWWLDDPLWRNGVRDYWQVTTGSGARLWLYYAHGAALPGGWFCQGAFA